ncbi:MAG: 16S rRNA (cytosine(967)-C(5))-methyltransferase RsmB [Thermodesulfobacteriota bacterium]
MARRLALAVFADVRGGRYAEDALSSRLDAHTSLGREDRALATELVYGVLRWTGRLDRIIASCSSHPSAKIAPQVRDILRVAVYQMFLLDRIPDHAAVDEAVTLARMEFGSKTAGFVNAVLRRAVREKTSLDPLPGDEIDSLSVYYSHPKWLTARWIAELGLHDAKQVLALHNTRAPMTLRANSLKVTRGELAENFRKHGFSVEESDCAPFGLRLMGARVPARTLPGYAEGLFAGQDVASQMIAPLLTVGPGERILDVCAAPGGKTAHLAALTGNEVSIVALEADPSRLTATEANLKRLGVTCAELIRADAADARVLGGLGTFDRILVDPPCSGLGVLRHNPETKARVARGDLPKYAAKELEILEAASTVLKSGGILVYSVCTPMREETLSVVDTFLHRHPNFQVIPIGEEEVGDPGLVRSEGFFCSFPPPGREPMDGFFAARMRRLGAVADNRVHLSRSA